MPQSRFRLQLLTSCHSCAHWSDYALPRFMLHYGKAKVLKRYSSGIRDSDAGLPANFDPLAPYALARVGTRGTCDGTDTFTAPFRPMRNV